MTHQKLPRRRIQRAFCQWLAESHATFSIPVTVSRRRDLYLECRLAGITNAIEITLTTYEILVSATMDGECWDLLACFDAVPKKSGEGYVCALCDPEMRANYPSREAIWRDEIFEPFRNWVNDTLAHGEWLAFYQTGTGGSSWVKMGPGPDNLSPPSENLYRIVPLRKKNMKGSIISGNMRASDQRSRAERRPMRGLAC